MTPPEVARLVLPTRFGSFEARAFETRGGSIYVALIAGDIRGAESALVRIHSECLTGDVLGSLRCDCGIQLQTALRDIAAAGCGALIYATGHEGRGIGLINKLKAYVEQDRGADTVDANLHLGFPPDLRDFGDAAAIVRSLEPRSVRLMTNNPQKADALGAAGVHIDGVVPTPVAASRHNVRYLSTKRDRMGHADSLGAAPEEYRGAPIDVGGLVGNVRPPADRPYVLVKYAQTLDGRIATHSGDSRWISGARERALSHALRAHVDAVIVGAGTVRSDDPQLTVRLVPGASPTRVILDPSLCVGDEARVLDDSAPTIVIAAPVSDPKRRRALEERGIAVEVVEAAPEGVHLPSALAALRRRGIGSVMIEGGGRVITSMLSERLADRIVVSIASRLIGAGTEAVGDLRIERVSQGINLERRTVYLVGEDIVVAHDVSRSALPSAVEPHGIPAELKP